MDDRIAKDKSQFKSCSKCSFQWITKEDFLSDPAISIVGYQVNFRNLELGLLLFNHKTCGTTLALNSGVFAELYDGPIYRVRKHGSEQCPEYCLNQSELKACPQECECVYIRNIIKTIQEIPKREFSRAKNAS